MITLNELLQQNGLFSKDIKIRISNKQILINNDAISSDDLKRYIVFYKDAGEYIVDNIDFFMKYSFLTFDEMFVSDIPKIKDKLSGISLLKLSKKQLIVIEII